MTPFLAGFLTAIAGYLTIGLVLGVGIVATHLAHFFAAGFQYKRMAQHVVLTALFWPQAIREWLADRLQR